MGSPFRLTPVELSEKYDLEPVILGQALERIEARDVWFVGFSGKIGAGKDTVAPVAFELLEDPQRVRTDSFGLNLKEEFGELIQLVQGHRGPGEAGFAIFEHFSVPEDQALHVADIIWEEVSSGTLTNGFAKTPASRLGLQYWATEVRRAQDPLHWVKPVIQRTIEAAAQGVSTQLTDVRFFTEVWGVLDAGGFAVRLDVGEEEQSRRIFERDGIEVSDAARKHSSEIELDGFEHFTARIQTEDYGSVGAVARAAALTVASRASTLL